MALASRRLLMTLGLVLAVVVGSAVTAFLVLGGSSSYESALSRLPESVLKASYTDWTAVDAEVGGPSVDATSSARELDAFVAKAFDQDLTVGSALSDSFPALAAAYEITPLDGEWEVYGQTPEGSVDLLRLSEDVDLAALEERFRKLGYDAPADGAGTSGVWAGTPELVAGLRRPLTPVQTNVAVVTSERLLAMSDDAAFLRSAVAAAQGDEPTLDEADGIAELVEAAGTPTVAELWAADFACEDLAMSQADPSEAARGTELVSQAGGVHPLDGLVMAQQEDRTLQVGMVFASSDQASADLQPRTDLARGAAPGQGGSFAERFAVADSVAEDRTITLTLRSVGDPIMRDIGQGPVLFLTC